MVMDGMNMAVDDVGISVEVLVALEICMVRLYAAIIEAECVAEVV